MNLMLPQSGLILIPYDAAISQSGIIFFTGALKADKEALWNLSIASRL
jgi:hypothetical protein